MGSKICDSCRKKLAKVPDLDTLPMSPTECGSPTGEQHVDVPAAVAIVNTCLLEIGETPLPPAAKDSRRIENKINRLAVAMKGLIPRRGKAAHTTVYLASNNDIHSKFKDYIITKHLLIVTHHVASSASKFCSKRAGTLFSERGFYVFLAKLTRQ